MRKSTAIFITRLTYVWIVGLFCLAGWSFYKGDKGDFLAYLMGDLFCILLALYVLHGSRRQLTRIERIHQLRRLKRNRV